MNTTPIKFARTVIPAIAMAVAVCVTPILTTTPARAQGFEQSEIFAPELARDYVVNAPVGVIIRSEPGTHGRKLGSLAEGDSLQLAGELVEGEPYVYATVIQDRDDPNASWVQISKPKRGWVLLETVEQDGSVYGYIVPAG